VRDVPDELLRELLADPDATFARPGVTILKDSRTSTVAELSGWPGPAAAIPGASHRDTQLRVTECAAPSEVTEEQCVAADPSAGGMSQKVATLAALPPSNRPRALILKRVRVRRWFEPLKNLFRRSALLRSWVAGHSLRDRWLPTPRPLAVLHRYRLGRPAEGYLLAEKVPDAVGLPEAVAALGPNNTAVLRGWIRQLARTLRAMHDRSVSHRDLKATNVMLAGAATDPATAMPVLVDLVGVRTGAAVPFRQRAKELARLNVSFLRSPAVTRGERLRFLRAYLAAGPAAREDWKTWWRAIAAATAVKVAKNRRTGRPLA
jgi:hypothetical protein